MGYHKVLGFNKEPFSTSPDPDFFYQSREHTFALYRLRVALELKRGLSLILGDVGTGKTTLSRRLAQLSGSVSNLVMTMVLNPIYESEKQFLADIADRFHIFFDKNSMPDPTALDYMKAIEKFLFEKSVEEGKTIVILIDESQKLINPCLEVLRSLLNYETNEYKILQVILMGQMELLPRISRIKNLWDRIAIKYVINPLEEKEAKKLIEFRLKKAGYVSKYPLFKEDAISTIYGYTQGYPRKIAMLCHEALEYLVMYKRDIVSKEIIEEIIAKDVRPVIA